MKRVPFCIAVIMGLIILILVSLPCLVLWSMGADTPFAKIIVALNSILFEEK
jgi:hypothetical protein